MIPRGTRGGDDTGMIAERVSRAGEKDTHITSIRLSLIFKVIMGRRYIVLCGSLNKHSVMFYS
jgi:hypothetical protein